MIEKFVEHLLYRLRDARKPYKKRINSGMLNPEEYKFLCGKLQGIKEVEYIAKILYKSMIERIDIKDLIDRERESYEESESY